MSRQEAAGGDIRELVTVRGGEAVRGTPGAAALVEILNLALAYSEVIELSAPGFIQGGLSGQEITVRGRRFMLMIREVEL